MSSEIEHDLERQIRMTHERFIVAMNARVPTMSVDQREAYFGMLSSFVARLEDPARTLRQVLQETVAEAGPLLFRELGK
jgi:hypothetical protein